MENNSGWRPMPVILKVIWILLLVGAVFSIFGVFTASQKGFMLLGTNLYGLYAVNALFGVNILAPAILLVAMYRRFRWAWIWGILLHFFMMVNESFMFGHIRESVDLILAELPEQYFDLVPDMYQIAYSSVFAGIVIGLLVDLFFLVVFVMKRKYFSAGDGQGESQK